MLVFFARSGGRHPILPVALGLLLGGSVSNLIDRVRLGHVTDFLDFRYWPAFNLADAFIVAGVAVLIGALLLADREPRRARTLQVLESPSLATAAGLRLDRFLADLPEVGSRAAAERLLEGAACSWTEAAREEPRGFRRRGGRASTPRAASRSSRRMSGSGSPTRTSTCSSSTSRRGSSCIRRPGHGTGTLVHGVLAHGAAGGGRGAAGNRPPARPRHLRASSSSRARRRLRAAEATRAGAMGSSATTWRSSAAGRAREAAGSRLRSAATARDPTRQSLDTDSPREAVTHFELVELIGQHALLRVASRPGGRTRSASISPRSACPSSATPSTARRTRRSAASSSTRRGWPSRIRFTGERVRGRVAAARAISSPVSRRRFARIRRVPYPTRRTNGGVAVPATCAGSTLLPPAETHKPTKGGIPHASRLDARAAGGRRPLRPPDPPLEPEDAPLHLHGARRHLHHRPAADLS